MTTENYYKAWRSGPDADLHVIVYERAEFPFGNSSLGPGRATTSRISRPTTGRWLEDTGFVVVRRRAVKFRAE
jgi:hypothetical protein